MKWSKLLILSLLCVNATWAAAQTSAIGNRLAKIKSSIKFTSHSDVEAYINAQVKGHKKEWEVALGKISFFMPAMQDSLESYDLPAELVYAALGWSLMDNERISQDGGSGFWQMRYIEAKRHGVYISSYVDMRRDYQVATGAASRYIAELYKEYGDWYMAMAAFAMGEVEVNKAIRHSGGSKDYWKIHEHLPVRYKEVIPAFIAGVYFHSYYKEHNLNPVTYKRDSFSVVPVTKWSSLYQISMALETEHSILKELNPEFKKDVIPNASTTYSIRIPSKYLDRFNELGDSVYTYPVEEIGDGEVNPAKPEELQTRNEVVKVETPAPATNNNNSSDKVVYYTVRSGDYLGRIADIYDVGVSQVRKWNNLSGDRINVGQKLKIYVPASKYSTYSKYNSYSRSQLDEIVKKD